MLQAIERGVLLMVPAIVRVSPSKTAEAGRCTPFHVVCRTRRTCCLALANVLERFLECRLALLAVERREAGVAAVRSRKLVKGRAG